MKEEADLAGNVFLVGHLSDGVGGDHEVIIVDPNERNLVRMLGNHLPERRHRNLSELLIHFSIITYMIILLMISYLN